MNDSSLIIKSVTPYVVLLIIVSSGFVIQLQENDTTNEQNFSNSFLEIINVTKILDKSRNGLIDELTLLVRTYSKGILLRNVIISTSSSEFYWKFDQTYSISPNLNTSIVIFAENETTELESLMGIEIFLIYSLIGTLKPLISRYSLTLPYVEPSTSNIFAIFFEKGKSTGMITESQSLFLQDQLSASILQRSQNYGIMKISSETILKEYIKQTPYSSKMRWLIFVQDKIPKFLLAPTAENITTLEFFFKSGGSVMFIGGKPLFETYSEAGDVSYSDAVDRVFGFESSVGENLFLPHSSYIQIKSNGSSIVEDDYFLSAYPISKLYLTSRNITYRAYGSSIDENALDPVGIFLPSAMAVFYRMGIIQEEILTKYVQESVNILAAMVFQWQNGGIWIE